MTQISLKQLVGDLVTPESMAIHSFDVKEIVRMSREQLLEIYNLILASKSEDGSEFECEV